MPGYIEARLLVGDIQRVRADLDNHQASDGMRIEDAETILTDTINAVDRDYNRVRAYRADNKAINRMPKRGEVYNVTFDDWSVGSEIRSVHPAVVLTANSMRGSDTVVVIPTTSATSRRERILDKRSQPKESWDDEAWSCIPVGSNPEQEETKFLDLKQIRVISPARMEMQNGVPKKLCTLTDDCLRDIEESMVKLFGISLLKDLQQKFDNTYEAKTSADKKIKALRKHMKSTQSLMNSLIENPKLDVQHILTNALEELEEALKL